MDSFISFLNERLALASVLIARILDTIREFLQTYTRPAYQTLKRRAVPILKTLGLLLTLAFAGASLYYAKAAADDAHCQLEIQKKQYCDTAPEEMRQKYPCDEILARGTDWLSVTASCCCGGPDIQYWELLFALPVPYYQSYGLTYCQGRLFGGEPWWLGWGKPYDLGFRPILWRFPDAYSIAGFLTRPVGMGTVAAGYVGVVWANVGNARAQRYAQAWFVCGLAVWVALSFWLVAAERERQAESWETDRNWRIRFGRWSILGTPLQAEDSEVLVPRAHPLWRSSRDWLLPWLSKIQSGVLSGFDYDQPIYHSRWIWED